MLARDQGAAARRARGGRDKRAAEQHSLIGNPIEMGRPEHIVDPPCPIDARIGAGVSAPVVGEQEKDIRPLRLGRPECRGEEDGRNQCTQSEVIPGMSHGTPGLRSGTDGSYAIQRARMSQETRPPRRTHRQRAGSQRRSAADRRADCTAAGGRRAQSGSSLTRSAATSPAWGQASADKATPGHTMTRSPSLPPTHRQNGSGIVSGVRYS